jgi:TonB family protein
MKRPFQIFAGIGIIFTTLSANSQSSPSGISFVKPEAVDAFYQDDHARSRVITDQDSLELLGKCESEDINFVLLTINGTDFPVYPDSGAFQETVTLQNGINTITTSVAGTSGRAAEKQVIVVEPHKYTSVEIGVVGGDWQAIDVEGLENPISVSSPLIRVRGSAFVHKDASLRVKDGYSQPVMVAQKGRAFEVTHVLNEGDNSLAIGSHYLGEPYHETQLTFELNKVVKLDLDYDAPQYKFLELSGSARQANSYTAEIPIKGHVPAIQNGVLSLSHGDHQFDVDIVDHQFSTIVNLPSEGLHQITAQINIEGKSFIDYLDVHYRNPQAALVSFSETQWVGSRFESLGHNELQQKDEAISVASPSVNLAGSIAISKDQNPHIVNVTSGQTFPVSANEGLYEVLVSLEQGTNEIQLRVGDSTHYLICDKLLLDAQPIFEINDIEGNLISDPVIDVLDGVFALQGSLPWMKEGSVEFQVGSIRRTIPVEDGRFSDSQPIVLETGNYPAFITALNDGSEMLIDVTVNVENTEVAIAENSASESEDASLTEVALAEASNQLKEQPVLETTDEEASEETRTVKREDLEGEFTPPVPIKTTKPGRVMDPRTYRRAKGFVVVRFTIGVDGMVPRESVVVEDSDNKVLEREAVRVVRGWEFKPAMIGDTAVEQSSQIKLLWN